MTTQTIPLSVPSRDDLVANARRARPVLAEHAAETERSGRPAPASLDAARSAGAFALATPSAHGGAGADMRTAVAVLGELGRGCPATAWLAALSTASQMFLRAFPERTQQEVRADPDTPIVENSTAGTLRPVEGGFRLSGRWPYASGCEIADWGLLMALLGGDDGRPPEPRFVAVPLSELRIERTWDVAGLQGTGSHTLVGDDVLVPRERVAAIPPDSGLIGTAVLRPGTYTSGALVGMAQGALDVVTALLAGDRAPVRTSYAHIADSPQARALFAEATQLVETARMRVERVAAALDAQPDAGLLPTGSALPATTRLGLRTSLVTAGRECRLAVDKLCDVHGSSAFATANPLQRFWRDLAVGTRHVGLSGYIVPEDYARAIVGVEPFASMLA